jgi:hypothetical protein
MQDLLIKILLVMIKMAFREECHLLAVSVTPFSFLNKKEKDFLFAAIG